MDATKKKFQYYGWVLVGLTFLCYFIIQGNFFSFSVFRETWVTEFNTTNTQIALYSSINSIAGCIVGLVAGVLIDKVSPRLTTMIALIFFCGGLLIGSFAQSVSVILLYGGLTGCAFGFISVPFATTMVRWFNRFRGTATGIMTVGVAVGQIVLPPLSTKLFLSMGSWRPVLRIYAVIGLVILAVTAYFIRKTPADVGLLPDCGRLPKTGTETAVTNAATTQSMTLKEAVVTRSFWALLIFEFAFCVANTLAAVYIVTYSTTIGMKLTTAALMMSVTGFGNAIIKIVGGPICDKLGHRNCAVFAGVIGAVGLLLLFVCNSIWIIPVCVFFYSVAFGLFAITGNIMTAQAFGPEHMGKIFSWISIGVGAGGFVGPILGGAILDATQNIRMCYLVAAAFSLLVTIAALLIKVPKTKK